LKLRSCGLVVGSTLGVLLVTSSAVAQEDRQDVLATRHHSYESTQMFAAELRISPFTPDIDSDPSLNGCTPFADTFGTGPSVLIGAELDWQALRIPHIGSFGPGIGIGTVSYTASAPFTSSQARQGSCLKSTGALSGEQTSLNIYPMYLVGVLRLDALWREVGVPLVPYAKLGFAAALWQSSNTLGTSNFNGQAGQGYSIGSQLGLGISFNLNVFDQYAAKNFDEAMGVNNTYIYAEWTNETLDGLGLQGHPLRVGGTSWTFGLTWEF
jgi:hypothetical protein